MANVRIKNLPADTLPSKSDIAALDNATTRGVTIENLVKVGRPFASQAEAEAGTDATKAMSPLTTAQAITAQGATQFATIAEGALANTAVQSIVGGVSASIDATNPQNPVVNFTGTGTGDMLAADYDPDDVGANAFDQDNMVDGTTNKNFTATEKTKLAGIGTGADMVSANNLSEVDAGSARKNLKVGVVVADRTAMKALDGTKDSVAFSKEAGRGGRFAWDSSDLSAMVTLDTAEGVYVAPTSDATGASGAWVRQFDGPLVAQWFGAIDGASQADMLTASTAIWNLALAVNKDFYYPAQEYEIGDANFPFRQETVSSLLDCGGISLLTDGPQTVFKTNTPDGADVFQLNGLKNFNIRGFPTLTSTLTGTAVAGCNGVSITNGGDNLYLEIRGYNLPSLDKGTNVDGGKALTIQPGTTSMECGRIIAHVIADGCAYGFGADLVTTTMVDKKMSVDVTLHAEDCYQAVVFGAGAATDAISDNYVDGITVRGQSVNCQRDLNLVRAYGPTVDLDIKTTKTAAERRLDPNGVAWITTDTVVEAMNCVGTRRGKITLRGDKGECDYKVRVGGTTAGSSGLTGQTQYCRFYLDIGGTAGTANISAVNSGGTLSSNCFFSITPTTETKANIPALLTNSTYANLFDFTNELRMVSPKVADHLSLAFASDGVTETGRLMQSGNITGLQGKFTSTTGAVIAGLFDQSGTFRLGIKNGNGIVVDALGTSTPIGTYVGKQPVYNVSGTLLGYFPIYN